MEGGLVLLLFVICAALYFVPAMIARSRNHKNAQAILVLNLFLGWTFLGWVAALVSSFSNDVREKSH